MKCQRSTTSGCKDTWEVYSLGPSFNFFKYFRSDLMDLIKHLQNGWTDIITGQIHFLKDLLITEMIVFQTKMAQPDLQRYP